MSVKRAVPILIMSFWPAAVRAELWVYGMPVGFGEAYALHYSTPDQAGPPRKTEWTALVDAGGIGQGKVLERELKRYRLLPVQAGFLSHPHANHLGGFQRLVQRSLLGAFYWSGYERGGEAGLPDLLQMLEEREVPLRTLKRGDQLNPIHGLRVTVLHPEINGLDAHENSLVVLVQYGQVAFLFSGDLAPGKQVEVANLLGQRGIAGVQVVTWPHHGDIVDPSWLNLFYQAQFVLIGVGPNPFNLPTLTQIQRSLPGRLLRTDHRPIRLRCDGVRVWEESP